MAKIPTTRLNSAPVVYEQNEFNQLIEDLQDKPNTCLLYTSDAADE